MGYSQIVMLNQIMYRIQRKEDIDKVPRPCERIDLIGGTGMGGYEGLSFES